MSETGKVVAVFGGLAGLPQTADDLVKALNTMNSTLQAGVGGKPLLRLLKEGLWVYGPNNTEVQDGSRWAFNPASLAHGWACWDDGVLIGEQMVPFNALLPKRDTLPDYGRDKEWKQQVSAEMLCTNGEDVGVEVLYKGTSLGQRDEFKRIIVTIMQQVKTDEAHFVPVVELDMDSYQHKKYGKTYTPQLIVKGWLDMHGQPAKAGPVAVAAPKRAAVEPTPEPAAATAAPAADAPPPPPPAAEPAAAAAAPAADAAPAPEVKRRRRAAV